MTAIATQFFIARSGKVQKEDGIKSRQSRLYSGAPKMLLLPFVSSGLLR